MRIEEIYKNNKQFINKEITIEGWIRFNRPSKNIGFIELTDGSKVNGIQLVYKAENKEIFNKLSKVALYSYIKLTGYLVEGKNDIELVVNELNDLRETEEDFPIGKKEHGPEFLRDIAHLRIKTKLFQSIMKVRHTASMAIHEFFNKEGFCYVHTPILTGDDAEGAGEAFNVSTEEGNFFNKQANLTVSGQLHAEGYAQALGNVYTFGPTFRAEDSHTTKHAAEFWMVEPEMAFADYDKVMKLGWDMLVYVINKVLENNIEELTILELQKEGLIDELKKLSYSTVVKTPYKEAVEILKKAVIDGVDFKEKEIEFGIDFGTEHEKYLAGEHFKSPVYIYDYPSSIKSFYMYQNGNDTCRGFDLLIPNIGELIGGSQRENRYDVLMETISKKGIDASSLAWYTDLRKNGYADSTGFGLGFERLVMYITGTENIRDVLPYPRTPGKLNF